MVSQQSVSWKLPLSPSAVKTRSRTALTWPLRPRIYCHDKLHRYTYREHNLLYPTKSTASQNQIYINGTNISGKLLEIQLKISFRLTFISSGNWSTQPSAGTASLIFNIIRCFAQFSRFPNAARCCFLWKRVCNRTVGTQWVVWWKNRCRRRAQWTLRVVIRFCRPTSGEPSLYVPTYS